MYLSFTSKSISYIVFMQPTHFLVFLVVTMFIVGPILARSENDSNNSKSKSIIVERDLLIVSLFLAIFTGETERTGIKIIPCIQNDESHDMCIIYCQTAGFLYGRCRKFKHEHYCICST
jgi:ABC-type amino acid transport system permease subunit